MNLIGFYAKLCYLATSVMKQTFASFHQMTFCLLKQAPKLTGGIFIIHILCVTVTAFCNLHFVSLADSGGWWIVWT